MMIVDNLIWRWRNFLLFWSGDIRQMIADTDGWSNEELQELEERFRALLPLTETEYTALLERLQKAETGLEGLGERGPSAEEVQELLRTSADGLQQSFYSRMQQMEQRLEHLEDSPHPAAPAQSESVLQELEQYKTECLRTAAELQRSRSAYQQIMVEAQQWRGMYQQAAAELRQSQNECRQIMAEMQQWRGAFQQAAAELRQNQNAYRQILSELDHVRAEYQDIAEKLKQSHHEPAPDKEPAPHSVRPVVSPSTLEAYLKNLLDLQKFDQFFETASGNENAGIYQSMMSRYRKNLTACVSKLDPDDDIEDTLSAVLNVIQKDFLKKIVIAVRRGAERGEVERVLLPLTDEYLRTNGLYPRETLAVGNLISREDYEDMEPIRDNQTQGRRSGEITEIELYPYYLEYLDEDGERHAKHTMGQFVVIA